METLQKRRNNRPINKHPPSYWLPWADSVGHWSHLPAVLPLPSLTVLKNELPSFPVAHKPRISKKAAQCIAAAGQLSEIKTSVPFSGFYTDVCHSQGLAPHPAGAPQATKLFREVVIPEQEKQVNTGGKKDCFFPPVKAPLWLGGKLMQRRKTEGKFTNTPNCF